VIEVRSVETKKQLLEFVKFPNSLYADNPYFVPFLISDELKLLDSKTSSASAHCKTRFFLAYKDAKIVGRVGCIINKLYNQKIGKKQLRFTRFDVIDDLEVSKALFAKVRLFAKQTRSQEIVGPIGFSDTDHQGMLVDGYDQMSLCITNYNFSYYKEHLESLGFKKEIDWVEYKISIPEKPTERIQKIFDLEDKIIKKGKYALRRFKNQREINKMLPTAIKIMDEAYEHLYGYVPLNNKQIKEIIANFKVILKPEFVFVVELKESKEVVGYGFIAPNLSKGFKKANGKLLPFGIFHLLHDIKHYDTIDFYSIGIKKQHQKLGANILIIAEGLKFAINNKVKYAETGPELETNLEVQAQWKDFEKVLHKRRRLYIKKDLYF
jgi:hypothetical protein